VSGFFQTCLFFPSENLSIRSFLDFCVAFIDIPQPIWNTASFGRWYANSLQIPRVSDAFQMHQSSRYLFRSGPARSSVYARAFSVCRDTLFLVQLRCGSPEVCAYVTCETAGLMRPKSSDVLWVGTVCARVFVSGHPQTTLIVNTLRCTKSVQQTL